MSLTSRMLFENYGLQAREPPCWIISESLPHGLLFWRGMTQWIRGLGIIMFMIAVLPIFGVSGLQIVCRRSQRPQQHCPRIGITAKWIWEHLYQPYLILVVLLMLGGMNWFDSVYTPSPPRGTGGFSTKRQASLLQLSPYIEYVISVFMFISGINFTLLLLFVNRKFKSLTMPN